MEQVIVYKFNGSLCIVYPSGLISITETAVKDVPKGVPYKIIDKNLIPEDRTFRDAWDMDMTNPDGVGNGYNWLLE